MTEAPKIRQPEDFANRLRPIHARLHAYIHALVRDLDDTDDLLQQTTMVLWRKYAEFDAERSFLAWALGVARFEVQNFLRSRSRQRLYFSDDLALLLAESQDEIPSDELDHRREVLATCMESLRERDRELLRDCFGSDQRVSETAPRRGRSPRSVHNSLRRIRRALHECVTRAMSRQSRPEWSA